MRCPKFHAAWLRWVIASVWLFHGLFSKVLDGIPRHRQIVARVVGNEWALAVTLAVGGVEILIGIWVLSRRSPRACAAAQTALLAAMNFLELWLARDLLLAPFAMVVANLLFLAIGWTLALQANESAKLGHESGPSPSKGT